MIDILAATTEDIQIITDIYNQAIRDTVATFDTDEKSITDRTDWFNQHDDTFKILVAKKDNQVIGWASLSKWSARSAYDKTAEISVYIDEHQQGLGAGKLLMKKIVEHAYTTDLHTIISRIAGDNDISVHLHKKYGFTIIGTMKEVGYKFNQFIDVHIMQLMLKE
ncbi:N-acetyltransferase family protein [Puteibacter caeruleilacunae]|nr:N-acetyltransferase family protein [Puteibacter caeruleilacunae]